MKRITPEMVVEAYNKTGLKPVQEEWYSEGFDNPCKACGLGAVAIARGAERDADSLETFLRQDGFEASYIDGFIQGFDDGPILDWRAGDIVWVQGFEDGNAARLRLIDLGDFEGDENSE